MASYNNGNKHYFSLPVDDWRDKLWFFGSYREYLKYLETGKYNIIDDTSTTRWHDGYLSSTAIIGPTKGE